MTFFWFNGLQIIIGCVLALAAALIGFQLDWLTLDGAFASFGVGLVVFGFGGINWAIVLLIFFISSSILSRIKRAKKIEIEKYAAKGTSRDCFQVLANGGLASVFVLLQFLFPDQWWCWIGFVASMAAANADTWATEIGAFSKARPSLITDGRAVEKGTSGAISLLGIFGSIGGAGIVALAGWLLWPGNLYGNVWIFFAIWTAGVTGSVVDSFLGATLQRVNYCPKCQKETEKEPTHDCGTDTQQIRGWKWLNNDWVNFFCALSAAVTAVILIGGGNLLRW